MKERFKTKAAAMVFLLRKENGKQQVLLQLRQNTGYADGMWDCSSSGHLEENESITTAAQRETQEEINISLTKEELIFICVDHKKTLTENGSYFNFYFIAENTKATPKICEPTKCKDLQWFDIEKLPDNMIADRKIALNNFFQKKYFNELNWE